MTINHEKFKETTDSYRKKMAEYLDQVLQIIEPRTLSPEEIIEFEKLDNNIISKNTNIFFAFECNMLMTKAFYHLGAIKYSNLTNNLHSLAIHTRVVLECAGQTVTLVKNVNTKNKKDKKDELSRRISDFTRLNMVRNAFSDVELFKSHVDKMKEHVDEQHTKMQSEMNVKFKKKKWRYSETVKDLEYGKNWYDYISEYFVHSDINCLKCNSRYGGVISNNSSFDIYFLAFFLDYVVLQSLIMIVSASFFDSCESFSNKYIKLMQQKNKISKHYKERLEQCLEK